MQEHLTSHCIRCYCKTIPGLHLSLVNMHILWKISAGFVYCADSLHTIWWLKTKKWSHMLLFHFIYCRFVLQFPTWAHPTDSPLWSLFTCSVASYFITPVDGVTHRMMNDKFISDLRKFHHKPGKYSSRVIVPRLQISPYF